MFVAYAGRSKHWSGRESGEPCLAILQRIAAVRGASNGLMSEMVEIHLAKDELVSGRPRQISARGSDGGNRPSSSRLSKITISLTAREGYMKSRAAVAFGPGQPLKLSRLTLRRRKGEVLVITPYRRLPYRYFYPFPAMIRKAYSPAVWVTKAAAW